MRGFSIGKVISILVLCVVVGWLLSVFGITPESFWQTLVNITRTLARWVLALLENSWGYLLAGAAVVLPIYLIMLIYRRLKRR
jgi:hypothetical protein